MIVVDTSAALAFLQGEPEADAIEDVFDGEGELVMSAFSALEARVVLTRRYGARAAADFDLLLARAGIRLVPFDADQSTLAHDAYQRYGKGMGHLARLNLGDCVSYALAMSLGAPLLFKGEDFGHTDVPSALA